MGRCGQMFRPGTCQEGIRAPAGPRLGDPREPYASPLTAVGAGVGPQGHTHHPAVHTLACIRSPDTRAHPRTHTRSLSMAKTPPSPSGCQNPLTPQGPSLDNPLCLGPCLPQPVSPTLSSLCTPRFSRGSPIGKHMGCGPSMWGEGGGWNRSPPSQTPFSPHSCPGTSPTSSPVAPTPNQAPPPAHP